MDILDRYGMVFARILLATVFLVMGFGKITNPDGTAAHTSKVKTKKTASFIDTKAERESR